MLAGSLGQGPFLLYVASPARLVLRTPKSVTVEGSRPPTLRLKLAGHAFC